MKKEIDIILPCYNPDLGWEEIVLSKYMTLQSLWPNLMFHLYIVNDGSSTGFDKKTVDYLIHYIPDVYIISYPENKGKGFALREAVKICRSDYILYTDCDFPYTIESMSKLIDSLLKGMDVVVASRGRGYYACLPLSRRMVSSFVRLCNRYLLRMEFSDTQAGLKGFSQFGRNIFLSTRINTYLFDWEFVYKASKNPSTLMKDVSVELRKEVTFSQITFSSYWKELKYYKWNLFI